MGIKIVVYIILYFSYLFAQEPELIAVFTFKSEGIDAEKSLLITDSLRSEIMRHKKFKVIDYQAMNKILQYNGFEEGYICDSLNCALVMGEFLSVEKVIQGTITKKNGTYSIKMRFVNLEKSENILDVTERYTGSFEGLLMEAIPNIGEIFLKSTTKESRKRRGAFIALVSGLSIAVAVPVFLLIRPKDTEPGKAEITLYWDDLIED